MKQNVLSHAILAGKRFFYIGLIGTYFISRQFPSPIKMKTEVNMRN
jgi:hypothetical protein